MQIIQVKNPLAAQDPALQEIVETGSKGGPYEGVEPGFLLKEALAEGSVHLAVHKSEYRGVALSLGPEVALFYAKKGSKKGLRSGLLLALVDFLKENHYTKVRVMSPAGVRDSVFKRAWKKAGKIKKVASIMELDLGA